MGDSGASYHITYIKNNLIDVEECNHDFTVGNGQNINSELKVMVNMKLHEGEEFRLKNVLYIPQAVKNLTSVSRTTAKGATMGATQDKTTINKNGVSMNMNARKGKNGSTIFYLKSKRFIPEIS